MTATVERGLVKSYDPERGVGHFFIANSKGEPTSRTIEFNKYGEKHPDIIPWLDIPVLSNLPAGATPIVETLVAGTPVVFVRLPRKGNPHCLAWALYADWKLQQDRLKHRPTRLRVAYLSDGEVSDVTWESSAEGFVNQLLELTQAYPRTGSDLISAAHREVDIPMNGYVIQGYRKRWSTLVDPRPTPEELFATTQRQQSVA